MQIVSRSVATDDLLSAAASAARSAAKACRNWEEGGCPDPVADTAEVALLTVDKVFAALQDEDQAAIPHSDPETRRGRLVVAAYMMLLAGSDEHGESADLNLAANILRSAAAA